jgi:putative transposase
MPEYRRSFLPGGTFFFTVVTYQRRPFLASPKARAVLRQALETIAERYPFTTEAICLLPDHLHCIWTLPGGDTNYSVRWSEIKKRFTKAYLDQIEPLDEFHISRRNHGEATVWQRRFWEHTIRDIEDFNNHLNYIHYNPVKHALVSNVADWRWSSFHRYVSDGYYDSDWGTSISETITNMHCGE